MPMRWEDERYVRLYTKDTATWKLLCWQAKCLLPLLLRKVDRAGIADIGEDLVEGVAALVDMPPELVANGLHGDGFKHGLLTREVFVVHGALLVMPNYIEAQEAKQSDAARQRAHRERARDLARAGGVVTKRDETVTAGHTASHAVTPSLAVPSRALPSRAEPEQQSPPPPAVDRATARGGDGDSVSPPHKTKPVQLEIADRVDPAPPAPPAPAEPAAAPEPAPGTPLTLAAFLEALAACSQGRFQISHRARPRERRNGAAEALTLGLPQLLFDQLRAELVREAPDLSLVQRAASLLAARDPADRSGRRFAFWGHWIVVTADNLRGRLHELLTAAAALVPAAPAELPRVTAEPNTPEYYTQLAALSEAQYGRR